MALTLKVIELLALSVLLGAVFAHMVATPELHRELGEAAAGRVRRAVLPAYCILGIACGLALAGVQIARGFLWTWNSVYALPACMFAAMTLLPAALWRRGRAWMDAAESDRAHRMFTLLNGAMLVPLLGYLLWMAARGW
jgi:hypothetical protein